MPPASLGFALALAAPFPPQQPPIFAALPGEETAAGCAARAAYPDSASDASAALTAGESAPPPFVMIWALPTETDLISMPGKPERALVTPATHCPQDMPSMLRVVWVTAVRVAGEEGMVGKAVLFTVKLRW